MRTISGQKLWYLLLLGLLISSGCKQSSPGVREFDRNLKVLSKQDFGTVEYFMMEHDIPEAYGVVEERSRLYDYLDIGDTFSTYNWNVDSREMIASHARFLTTARHSFYDTNFNVVTGYGGSDAIIYWRFDYKPHIEKNCVIGEWWKIHHLNDTSKYLPEDSTFFFFENGRLIKEITIGAEGDSLVTDYTYSNDRLIAQKLRGGIIAHKSYNYQNGLIRNVTLDITGGSWLRESDYKEEELWYDDQGYPMKKVVRTDNDTIVVSFHFKSIDK